MKKYLEKYIGEEFVTNEGYTATVIAGGSKPKYCVIKIDSWIKEVEINNLKKGNIKNPYKPSLCEVGFFGDGPYKGKVNKKRTDNYVTWSSMIRKSYKDTSKGLTVHTPWHNFQIFSKWFEDNYPKDGARYKLEKQTLEEEFSPTTCSFIPFEANIHKQRNIDKINTKFGDQIIIKEYIEHKEKGDTAKIYIVACDEEHVISTKTLLSSKYKLKCTKNTKEKNKFVESLGENYELIDEYNGYLKKVKLKHIKCGTEFTITPNSFVNNDLCPTCALLQKGKDFIDKINKRYPDEFEILNEYKSATDIIKVKHLKCGGTFEVPTYYLMTLGSKVAHCCREETKSTGELALLDFIKENYDGEIRHSDRTVLKPKELDIYLPELNLAFEFDGLYWHSEAFKSKQYHLDKTTACESKGIQLIHIFENEWELKKEIVKSRVLNLLKKSSKRVFARKTKLVKVTNEERINFFEENHIQADVTASIQYGLEFEGELVSMISFSKLRNSMSSTTETATHELLRFSNKLGHSVVGGFSKLLKNTLKLHPEIKEVKTFADRRWSIGNSYEKNNFTFSHNTNPNYFYFKNFNLENRIKYQKHKLESILKTFDESKTEKENMIKNGYHVIYDSGNKVYYYKND